MQYSEICAITLPLPLRSTCEAPREAPRGGDRLGSGHPQKIIESPHRIYKAPKHYTKTHHIRQRPQIFNNISTHLKLTLFNM